MRKAHAAKRVYRFETMAIGRTRYFDYEAHNRVRWAVWAANKRGDGHFVCRVVRTAKGKKRIAVIRMANNSPPL